MREAIGTDVDLMCDINQLWSVHHAIDVGQRIADYHLYWLEDPTAHDDFARLARIADALDTPIAAGEYHYRILPFRHPLETRAIGKLVSEPPPAGGTNPWWSGAGAAQA